MMDERELQSLVEFSGAQPVLSLYLDTNLAHQSKDAVKLLFREHTKQLPKEAAVAVRAISTFLDLEYDWQARGLAVFASGQELWKTIPLPIAPRTQAVWTSKPYVRVLSDVLDRFGAYGIALFDQRSVRLFSVAGGKIQTVTESFGEDLKRHKQGGWAAARYQRHEDNLVLHNLKQAVEVVQAFCQDTGCKRLMLAGGTEVLAQVRELLPSPLRSQIIGEFTADVQASPSAMLTLSLDIAAHANLAEEQQLVSQVVTAAAKGGAGVIGLADTLSALHQGRVHQLLVEENYAASGYVCGHCGYIAAEHVAKCPFCGYSEISASPDVVNRAIHKAIETGATVNVVRASEALTQAGGVAALLRY